jgi:small subunit ribosomal protein S27e
LEAGKHKLKRLVQSPNSFFMDVKCQVRTTAERAIAPTPTRATRTRVCHRKPLLTYACFKNQQGCFSITTIFSHSQTVVLCGSCSAVLCQPTGGKARLTEGCEFRPKGN